MLSENLNCERINFIDAFDSDIEENTQKALPEVEKAVNEQLKTDAIEKEQLH